jgi:hypothetical protein
MYSSDMGPIGPACYSTDYIISTPSIYPDADGDPHTYSTEWVVIQKRELAVNITSILGYAVIGIVIFYAL